MSFSRLQERFEVTNGVVIYSVKKPFGLGYQRSSAPHSIYDMSLRGLCFLAVAPTMKPGARLRLEIHVSKHPSFEIEAKVVRVAPLAGKSGAISWTCAVEFTRYDERNWACLRALETSFGRRKATVSGVQEPALISF